MFFEIQTSVRSPPPQPISSNWKFFRGFNGLFIFDDDDDGDWRSCSRMNGIRSWFNECNAAYSPVSFHHEDDNLRKRLSSSGSTELCIDNEREDNGINLGEKIEKKIKFQQKNIYLNRGINLRRWRDEIDIFGVKYI